MLPPTDPRKPGEPRGSTLPPAPGVELARLAAPASDGTLHARFGDGPAVPVRVVVGLDPASLTEGASALAVRVAGEDAPVVIGVVTTPNVERLARRVDFEPPPAPAPPPAVGEGTLGGADGPLHVVADGRRVTVEAADELVLRCGEASLTLRADGKVVVRGTHILSHSTGPHRLKGGSFSIN